MDNMGAFLDTEWESICKLLSVEEPDISSHLLDYSPPASVQDDNISFITPFNFSYESGQSLMGDYSEENYVNVNAFADNVLFGMSCCNDLPVLDDVSLGLLLVEDARNEIDDGSDLNSANQSSCDTELTFKRKLDRSEVQDKIEVKTPKKKARVSRANAGKGKRKVQAKKDDEEIPTALVEEERDGGSLDNSEGESHEEGNEIAEPESNQTTGLTSTGKKRANRGAATDPQSLYARKRRMRINERLRTLQNLVPNGTKVDISTMLDEAFHYVKFLELQMRLLSSDDMWMFAPLVYNGFDVGRLSPFMAL